MKDHEKVIVSPFEFSILEIADPERAKNCRPETENEKQERLKVMAQLFASKIKVKKAGQ